MCASSEGPHLTPGRNCHANKHPSGLTAGRMTQHMPYFDSMRWPCNIKQCLTRTSNWKLQPNEVSTCRKTSKHDCLNDSSNVTNRTDPPFGELKLHWCGKYRCKAVTSASQRSCSDSRTYAICLQNTNTASVRAFVTAS